MTAPVPTGRIIGLLCLSLLTLPRTAPGQVLDARLVPPGVLRVGFTPEYQSWDRVYRADGSLGRLGQYLSSGAAGSDVFSTLIAPEAALRAITGNQSYRINLGSMVTTIDADTRRFPFEFTLGLSRWLALSATLPIIVTRVNTHVALDSATGEVGWNQAAAESGNAGTGQFQLNTLLSQLDAGATTLEARIGSGDFGCPGSPQCVQAQTLLTQTRALRINLRTLSGAPLYGSPLPGVAPIATSAAGVAIRDTITRIGTQLQAFGSGLITTTMPLPTRRLSATDALGIMANTAFGYEAELPAYTKHPALGDVEVGAKIGLLQTTGARMIVSGTARLPTGTRDLADNLADIGTGDRQLDAVAGFEAAFEPGPVSLTLAASYTWQLPGPFLRRVTPPHRPLALSTTAAVVDRDLGEVLWASAHPAVHLSEGFRLYGTASYYRKGADHFTATAATPLTIDPSVLDAETAMHALSLGGGLAYRSTGRTAALPVEAGLSYQTTVSGGGGFAPKATVVTMYVRAYYRLWGQ